MITSRATVNVGNNRFDSNGAGAKRHEGELRENTDAGNAKGVEPEKTRFVEMAAATMT